MSEIREGEYLDPADGLIHCRKCSSPRQAVISNPFHHGRDTVRCLCSCQVEAERRREEAHQRRQRMDRIQLRKAQGLQDRYLYDYTFAHDNGQNPVMAKARAYVEHWQSAFKKNVGLLLFGDVGTGKSFLAGCIANALLDQDVPVLMTSFPTILARLSGMFGADRADFLASLGDYDLLIIDDLGVERGTEYATFVTDTDTFTDTFTLCGIWDGDAVAYRQTILLSKEYTEQVAPVIRGETDGATPPVGTGYIDTVMMMPTEWDIEKQALEVTSQYGLEERVSINDTYGTATVSLSSMLPLAAGIVVIFIAGYLLIYNVFYISIAQDIRFYGMLKTLGTTARQIRKIVYKKAIKLSLVGIPLGLLLGWPIGRLLLPFIVNMLTDDMQVVTTINPVIFLAAVIFSLITVFISCKKPAALASKVSPMEALHYVEQSPTKKKQRRSKHISTTMMAKNNLGRNKKKVMIVTLSFALSIVLLNSVYTYVTSFDFDKFVADFSLTDFVVADTTVINSYAPFNTANVSQDFISQAESLNGLGEIGSIYLWTSKQPLSENDLARLQELAAASDAVAKELGNYMVRQEHGVKPAERLWYQSGWCLPASSLPGTPRPGTRPPLGR